MDGSSEEQRAGGAELLTLLGLCAFLVLLALSS